MSKRLYRESLTKLAKELKNSTFTDPHAQAVSGSLMDDIQKILEHPGEVTFLHHHNLMNNLKISIRHFEVSHPSLTGLMDNVINTLNNLGI
jgi:hypothetical protein